MTKLRPSTVRRLTPFSLTILHSLTVFSTSHRDQLRIRCLISPYPWAIEQITPHFSTRPSTVNSTRRHGLRRYTEATAPYQRGVRSGIRVTDHSGHQIALAQVFTSNGSIARPNSVRSAHFSERGKAEGKWHDVLMKLCGPKGFGCGLKLGRVGTGGFLCSSPMHCN